MTQADEHGVELAPTRGDPAAGDPFLEEFFQRIPDKTARTFTRDQLIAIKMAFGARSWGVHSIDLRLSLPLLWRRFYLVLLMGPERRSPKRRRAERKRHPLATLGNVYVALLFLAIIAVPLGLASYGDPARFREPMRALINPVEGGFEIATQHFEGASRVVTDGEHEFIKRIDRRA